MPTTEQQHEITLPNLETRDARPNRPRSKTLSAIFFLICRQVHLWLGLSFGALTAIAGLSGSILIFRPEIDRQIEHHLRQVNPRGAQVRVNLQLLLDSVQKPRDAVKRVAIRSIEMPRAFDESIEFWTKEDGPRIFVNPYTGSVLGQRREIDTFTGWIFSLHHRLLGGQTGENVMGWTGLALFVMAGSGVIVWWPRKNQRFRDGLTVKAPKGGSGWKRTTYDLHRAGGFYASLLLVLAGLTGASLVFPDAARAAFATVSGSGSKAPSKKPKAPAHMETRSLPLDSLVDSAEKALPGGQFIRITLPQKPRDPIVFRKRFENEMHPNGMNSIYLDPFDGKVLAVDSDAKASPVQKAMNFRYPLHVGVWAGLISRVLMACAGLMPSVLLITGVSLWFRRARNKWNRRRGNNKLALERA